MFTGFYDFMDEAYANELISSLRMLYGMKLKTLKKLNNYFTANLKNNDTTRDR